ncbi:MAG TPA: methyltransferase domain-containing protein, partial [Aggregatilineales bacterium]|nr:methyltransferase domain-containing protein [Aggregatilineales bacterium]
YLNMFRYVSKCRLVGGDLDWDVLLKAKNNLAGLPDITLNHASIYALPYPDNTFDAVILSEVLEHLDDDVAGLKEAYRVLKPGGVVVITVPNADYPFLWDPINRTLQHLFKTHISKGMLAGIWANHVRLYTREELRQNTACAGFIIEEERAFTHYSFPFIHNLVYGIGKPLLEAGALPSDMAKVADRTKFDEPRNSTWWNPITIGLSLFNYFDRRNSMNESPEKSTVNLCIKGRKPQ